LDRQLLDTRLFEDEDQLVGGTLQLGLSGPILPQIPFMVPGELVNLPLNQAVAGVAGQAINPPVIPPVGESTGWPVRSRKRLQVAIEVEDEPTLWASGCQRQKRTV
jgi:hypothetical protein